MQKKSESNRGCKYIPDAYIMQDGRTYNIELKTGSNTSFSTARGMGREKINDWKQIDFFIFSKYKKQKNNNLGFEFTQHVICTPEHLGFFFDHVIDKVHTSGHAGKIGRDQWYNDIKPRLFLIEPFTSDKKLLEKLEKTINVGTEYNDPKISINKIIKNGGHQLDLEKDLPKQIKKYILNNT